jgi:hypothetical protein
MKKLVLLAFLLSGSAGAQTLDQMQREIEARRDASTRTLREAIIKLRDAREASCRLGPAYNCDLVGLSNIELALLDLQEKYRLLARRSADGRMTDALKKVDDAAGRARSEITELEDALESLGKR